MVIAHNFVGIKWNNINFNSSLHTYLYKSMNVKSTKKKKNSCKSCKDETKKLIFIEEVEPFFFYLEKYQKISS